ncbi:PREDICTED: chromatin assembly factor 1 subunit A [Gekko japonicus]|uniref:Chromatin assembly factor 1 subunit A n=1 Tax=Gekko japonicus TaxID=146911 RepID=A0ABM1JL98_GEKJA|nr:PREDICTED: chromatin assembly factor 1 subunit A [Gekko japonicus]
MECQAKPATPARKLIQARLPFKRLNPVPKEKLDADSGVKKLRNSQNVLDQNNAQCPSLSDLSPDDAENSCRVETKTQFIPKLVNGKGPLDSFVKKNNTSPSLPSIDLTEDSSDGPSSKGDHGTSKAEGVLTEKANEMASKPSSQKPVCNSQVGVLAETDPLSPAAAHKGELSDVLLAETGVNRAKEGALKNVLFQRKMPVVLLEDIMAIRSPKPAPLEGSPPSGNDTSGSSHVEDSACTNSSFSSLSSISSPETLPAHEQTRDADPLASSTPVRKVNQKSQRSAAEKEKLRLQKDQERADKLQKLQAEREEKERLKEEARAAKERSREETKRKKEEEKELKEKERREKKEKDEREKAEKLRAKEEKRKEKQEALEAKLEEKRKKEEEKRLKEEEKRIKAEKAEITRFFQKPKTPPAPKTLAGWCGKFAPFEIKENMVLSPLCRVAFDQDLMDQLDYHLQDQSCDASLLKELKGREPGKSGPTLLRSSSTGPDVNSDVVVVGSSQAGDVPERKKFGRMKLLQFCENHRPAYWGTWNKKSSFIKPRNPWSKDTTLLDYEVESDEEWEEEEPGESLSHSEGDDDEDGGEEEDEDDGFFVPHGYLSEDEGVTEKVRQKLKAKEWDELIAKGKRLGVLQPVKIGCVWEGQESSHGSGSDLKLLQQFQASVLDTSLGDEEQTEKSDKKKTTDQQILGQLLPLLHGNINGSKVIIQEFQGCCRLGLLPDSNSGAAAAPSSTENSPMSPNPSRAQTPVHEGNGVPSKARLKRIISENSVYEKRPEHRMCWYVHPEVLKSFGQEDLPVPCQWNYTTQVPSVTKEEGGNSPGVVAAQTTPVSAKRKSTGSMSITKFMKRPRGSRQAETTEMDGFQADTEEEDEDECILLDVQQSAEPASGVPVETEGKAAEEPTLGQDTVDLTSD